MITERAEGAEGAEQQLQQKVKSLQEEQKEHEQQLQQKDESLALSHQAKLEDPYGFLCGPVWFQPGQEVHPRPG